MCKNSTVFPIYVSFPSDSTIKSLLKLFQKLGYESKNVTLLFLTVGNWYPSNSSNSTRIWHHHQRKHVFFQLPRRWLTLQIFALCSETIMGISFPKQLQIEPINWIVKFLHELLRCWLITSKTRFYKLPAARFSLKNWNSTKKSKDLNKNSKMSKILDFKKIKIV